MTENHPITPPPEPMIPDYYRGNDIRVYREGFHAGYKYAAARGPKPPSLAGQVLLPVSVSERLPEAEDCDAEGRCWWWDGEWGLIEQRFTDYIVTHWLPAHALPLPEVNNG